MRKPIDEEFNLKRNSPRITRIARIVTSSALRSVAACLRQVALRHPCNPWSNILPPSTFHLPPSTFHLPPSSAFRSAFRVPRSAFLPTAFSLNPFSLGVPRGRQRGIALLIVIGLTAMLMLLGAAFAIYMRTERLASGNFKNDVRARQLLHVALARAMDAVETSCNNANAIYPPFDVLYTTNTASPVENALTGWDVTKYLPRGAFTSSWDNIVNNKLVGWTNITVGGEDVRYAYVVLNVSGLFDANQVGAPPHPPSVRGAGTNVQEIFLKGMPDYDDEIFNLRAFESLPDLITNTLATNNFVVFQPYLRTNNLVDLSGSVLALSVPAKSAKIISTLGAACGINAFDASMVYSNLLDYVDSSRVAPLALDMPCTKKVPMLNEARVTVTYGYEGKDTPTTTLVYSAEVKIESWYPYSTAPIVGSPFTMDFTVQAELKKKIGAPGNWVTVPNSAVGPTTFTDASFTPGANSFHQNTLNAALPQKSVDCAGLYNSDVRVVTKLSIMRIKDSSENPVDQAPYPASALPFTIPGGFDAPTKKVTVKSSDAIAEAEFTYAYGIECIDPRCNWMQEEGEQWVAYGNVKPDGTPNAINQATIDYLAVPANYTDGHYEMYVANRGCLVSVGELTYLMRSGQPKSSSADLWSTIRLVPPPGNQNLIDPIFDHFTIGTNRESGANASETARDWGLVNVNSRNSNIWAAVFTDMSLDRPGAGGTTTNNPAALAAAWINTLNNFSLGNMTNVTDFCRAGWSGYGFGNSALSAFTPLEQESFFINTAGLLGVRQNTFVILLYGEPTRTIYRGNDLTRAITSPLSGIRAVATVWRDPMRDPGAEANEPHHWFVRSFDILKNE